MPIWDADGMERPTRVVTSALYVPCGRQKWPNKLPKGRDMTAASKEASEAVNPVASPNAGKKILGNTNTRASTDSPKSASSIVVPAQLAMARRGWYLR